MATPADDEQKRATNEDLDVGKSGSEGDREGRSFRDKGPAIGKRPEEADDSYTRSPGPNKGEGQKKSSDPLSPENAGGSASDGDTA